MQIIGLKHGVQVKLDDADYSAFGHLSMFPVTKNGRVTSIQVWIKDSTGKRVRTGLHRLIMGARPCEMYDHIDGDPSNNQRSNLRLCNPTQNAQNRKKTRGSSIYKGVCRHITRWKRKTGEIMESVKWQATINVGKKQVHLGLFDTEYDAARAYDQRARRLFKDFSRLNFPPPGYQSAHS